MTPSTSSVSRDISQIFYDPDLGNLFFSDAPKFRQEIFKTNEVIAIYVCVGGGFYPSCRY